jgi:hypothetical protein
LELIFDQNITQASEFVIQNVCSKFGASEETFRALSGILGIKRKCIEDRFYEMNEDIRAKEAKERSTLEATGFE